MGRPFSNSPKRSPLPPRRQAERVSEYFDFQRWPEKAERKVTRLELFAILQRRYAVERDMRWYRRLWRWLRNKMGSGRLVVPQPPEET